MEIKFDFEPPTTLNLFKSRAKRLKKAHGIKLTEAHEILAKYCKFGSFHEARINLLRSDKERELARQLNGKGPE